MPRPGNWDPGAQAMSMYELEAEGYAPASRVSPVDMPLWHVAISLQCLLPCACAGVK